MLEALGPRMHRVKVVVHGVENLHRHLHILLKPTRSASQKFYLTCPTEFGHRHNPSSKTKVFTNNM